MTLQKILLRLAALARPGSRDAAEPSGSVEAVDDGTRAAVDALLARLTAVGRERASQDLLGRCLELALRSEAANDAVEKARLKRDLRLIMGKVSAELTAREEAERARRA